jgi:heptosyltransferase-3
VTKTLVVHTGAIGDFLLACPALQELSKREELTLAGNTTRLALAVAGGIAQAAQDLDAIGFHSIFTEPTAKLRGFLKDFDRVVVWMRDNDGAIHRGLKSCGVRSVDVFPGLPDAKWTQHASAYYAECLGFHDLPPLHLPILPVGLPLDVVIHPGSGSPKKNWPIEDFLTVARTFSAEGRRVTWCMGPAEDERGFRDLSGELLQCASLVELAARLVTARFYVGNDTGITHLAAALGVPTVAIFGPTDPRIWAPRGENVRVMRMRRKE